MLLPALAKAKLKAQRIYCVNHLKQFALTAKMYSDDNRGNIVSAYPTFGGFTATWCGGNAETGGLRVSYVYFFFSSRGRHTRLTCDWSSDVCSSDLKEANMYRLLVLAVAASTALSVLLILPATAGALQRPPIVEKLAKTYGFESFGQIEARSEERRVGKECRSRWSPDYIKKNAKQ